METDEEKVLQELLGLIADSHGPSQSSVIVGTCGKILLTSIGEFTVEVKRVR